MTTVVISQPMLFPWVGLFEQIRLADVYVHYDDVQFSKGSFTNRVQVKTASGSRWLTLPLHALHLGQRIAEVALEPGDEWRKNHLALLADSYRGTPFVDEMLALAGDLYARPHTSLADLTIDSIELVLRYFEFARERPLAVVRASALGVRGATSDRVAAIVTKLGGTRYVTGHGARGYLDHELFESRGIQVEYLDYQKTPYRQLHGPFTPYVSVLDLIANEGRRGADVIASPTVGWREFLARAAE